MTIRRRVTAALIPALLLTTACGGSSSESDERGSETSEGSDQAFDGVLGSLVSAIEANDFTCQPESMAMTSAERAICNTFSSIGVSAYVWADAETMSSEIDAEVYCTSDSHLGELRFLRGDTWAVSAFSLSESTADRSEEIDAVLASLQTALSGELDSKPCG